MCSGSNYTADVRYVGAVASILNVAEHHLNFVPGVDSSHRGSNLSSGSNAGCAECTAPTLGHN